MGVQLLCEILASVPSEICLLTLDSFYNARDSSKRLQSQIQKDDYLKHNLL